MASPILITGGSGQVGGAISDALTRQNVSPYHVHTPSRAELDLTDPESIQRYVREVRPRWILNPGAYTAVDKAESEPEVAYKINAEAADVLGREARAIGAAVIHFSTDYVFPGTGTTPHTETDATGPLGVYGASKLAGEQALAASGAAHLILRTSWVYGATGKNFPLTILRVARERARMTIVGDQFGAPTSAGELARITLELMNWAETVVEKMGGTIADTVASQNGVYHAAAMGETTWFGFAAETLRLRRMAEPDAIFAELAPISTSDYPTPARRPLNSRLDCSKLERTFGITLKPWEQALAEVDAEWARP